MEDVVRRTMLKGDRGVAASSEDEVKRWLFGRLVRV